MHIKIVAKEKACHVTKQTDFAYLSGFSHPGFKIRILNPFFEKAGFLNPFLMGDFEWILNPILALCNQIQSGFNKSFFELKI